MKTTRPDKKLSFNATFKRIHSMTKGITGNGKMPDPDFVERIMEARFAKNMLTKHWFINTIIYICKLN